MGAEGRGWGMKNQPGKAVVEVYGQHNPRVLWRAVTVPLLDYGRKENTRLIVRGPAFLSGKHDPIVSGSAL